VKESRFAEEEAPFGFPITEVPTVLRVTLRLFGVVVVRLSPRPAFSFRNFPDELIYCLGRTVLGRTGVSI
jgi:hypothetical protein